MLLALAIAAATMSVDVPATLDGDLDKAKDRTGLAILLPQTIETDQPKAFGNLNAASKKRYDLVIGAAKNCNGASVCGIASFSAVRGTGVVGGKRVALAKGREGRYHRSTCGANCSFPSIEWHERGAVYVISYKESRGKANMVRLADSAITAGPR